MDRTTIYLVLCCLLPLQVLTSSPALNSFTESNAKFSRDFYKSVQDVEGNLVSSPLSAQMALGMTYLGARGSTASTMRTALSLTEDDNATKSGFKELISALQAVNSDNNNNKLKIANRIYIKSAYEIQQEFITDVVDTFSSSLESVDFTEAGTRDVINHWVEEVTENKIKDLVAEGVLDDNTRLVLINAMYFYGKWTTRFDPGFTVARNFYTSDTASHTTKFMSSTHKYNFATLDNVDAKLIELPYEGGKLSMVVLLPNSRTGVAALEQKMLDQDVSTLLRSATPTLIDLFLPRFKIETKLDLVDPLSKMGLDNIFSNEADFSGISSSERLKISHAVQKTIIQVGENGTEAVTATYFAAVPFSVDVNPPPSIFVDHPFLFFILHKTADQHPVVLFSGRVSDANDF